MRAATWWRETPVDRGLQQELAARHKPQTYGPEPDQVVQALRNDIANAFGVSPALLAERGDGAGQRESWRRFWLGTVAPLARMIEAECRAKLDAGVSIGLDALRAAEEGGRRRSRCSWKPALIGMKRGDWPGWRHDGIT